MKSCCAISLATCSDTLHCRDSTELHGCRPDVCILPYCISSGMLPNLKSAMQGTSQR